MFMLADSVRRRRPRTWAHCTSRTGSDRGFGTAAGRALLARFDGVSTGMYNSSHVTQMTATLAYIRTDPANPQRRHDFIALNYQVPWENRGLSTTGITVSGTVATVQMPTGNAASGSAYPSTSSAALSTGAPIGIWGSPVAGLNGEFTVTSVDSTNRRFTFTVASGTASDSSGSSMFLSRNDANYARFKEISQRNWWLRRVGTAGRVRNNSRWNTSTADVNLTTWTPTNPSGERYPQFLARFGSEQWYSKIPGMSGAWQDNVLNPIRSDLYTSETTSDYQRTGTPQAHSNATVVTAHMQGLAAFATAVRAIAPTQSINRTMFCFGNLDNDGSHPELTGKYNGVFYEHALRTSGDKSNRPARIAGYKANLLPPRTIVYHYDGTDDQAMTVGQSPALYRRGICLSLIEADGHFAADYNIDRRHDEAEAPLGVPIEPDQTAARSGTIWYRRFVNGIVLYNASTTASATLAMTGALGGYRRLAARDRPAFLGAQTDPATNTGAAVSSLTLEPQRGIILVRV